MPDDREDRVTKLTDITGAGALDDGLGGGPMPFDDRYVRKDLLGRGGMGEVFLCDDRSIGREVALKVIRENHRDSADHRVRFLREACIQGQLEHPAIVPIHDLGDSSTLGPYFVMKRVRGTTLLAALRGLRDGDAEAKAKFTRGKLIAAFRQLCQAIDYAHAHGVVHRDLKPANVMLGDFGEVHVLDWGLAKRITGPSAELTMRGVAMGTPGYMAPEQRDDSSDVDARTDVYALGAILFEILTLRPLAPRTSDRGDEPTVPVLASAEVTLIGDGSLTPELQAICLTATRADPTERYRSVHDLVEAVDRYLSGDRDLELRRTLAVKEAAAAGAVVDRALERNQETEEHDRAEAIKQVTRALALDPENLAARHALARLMLNPPSRRPAAVLEKMQEAKMSVIQFGARAGFTALLLIGAIFIPLVLNMGVLDVRAFGLYLVLHAVLLFGSARDGFFTPTKAPYFRIVQLVLAMVAIGVAGRTFGPMIIVPNFAAGFLVAMIFHARRNEALAMILTTVLCLLAPVALEYAGVLPRSYSFTGDAMIIHAQTASMKEGPAMLVLIAATIGAALLPASNLWRLKRQLDEAQAELALRAWYLDASYDAGAGSSSAT